MPSLRSRRAENSFSIQQLVTKAPVLSVDKRWRFDTARAGGGKL
jgi:hypothetical protein